MDNGRFNALLQKGITENDQELLNYVLIQRTNGVDRTRHALDAGADVNARDRDGYSALHFARTTEQAKLLINSGADINAVAAATFSPGRGESLLHTAKDAKLTQYYIDNGCEHIHLKDMFGRTALHNAADGAQYDLLVANGADPCSRDDNGRIPPNFGRDLPASYDAVDRRQLITPLFWNDDSNELNDLIESGVDLEERDFRGRTALFGADAEKSRFLIAAGADIDARDHDGNTPLHFSRDSEVAKLLLQNGAETDAKNGIGQTPLDFHRMQQERLTGEDIPVIIESIEQEQQRRREGELQQAGKQEDRTIGRLFQRSEEQNASVIQPVVTSPPPPRSSGAVVDSQRDRENEQGLWW